MTARRLRIVDEHALARFAIGVRVSRVMGRSGDTFHSPETQQAGARRAVELAGGIVDETVGDRGVFYDLDVSGAIAPSDRPGLGAALDLIRAGRLEGVAVYDLSRWSRETVSGLRELEEIAAVGGQVLSGSETIDLITPAGRFSTTIQLAAHQMRRDEAQRAWKATHAARFDQGKPHGAVPLGYQRNDSKQAVIDLVLAGAVQQAFTDFAAGIVSQLQLATRFTELRGKKVWQATISDMLRSPFYTGHVRLNGQTTRGRHEPLVDDLVWQAVQRRLALTARAGISPRERGQLHPLVGMLFCDLCGHALWRRAPGAKRVGTPGAYVLVRCRHTNAGCPGIGNPRYEAIELEARDEAVRLAGELRDDAAARIARNSRRTRATVDATALREELRDTEKALARAAGMVARERMSEAAYVALERDLEASSRALHAQLAQAEQVAVEPNVTALASAGARLLELWDDMTSGEKRSALQPFIRQVRVRPAAFPGEPVSDRVRCIPVE